MDFLEDVLYHIPRATKREKEDIRSELENHLLDHQEALAEKGVAPQEARRKAEAAMGDPAEIGRALNAQLSPFWLWAKRVIQVALCLLLIAVVKIYPFSKKAWTGTWEVLVGAWDNTQARQGKGLHKEEGVPSYDKTTHAWSCWETMRVGDEMVCLYWVELHPMPDDLEMPGYYAGDFYFCTYNVDLFGPANGELLERLTVTSESKMERPEYMLGWLTPTYGSRGVQERFFDVLVKEGDAYVDVTYDYFGITAAMRCPLTWEKWEEVGP